MLHSISARMYIQYNNTLIVMNSSKTFPGVGIQQIAYYTVLALDYCIWQNFRVGKLLLWFACK